MTLLDIIDKSRQTESLSREDILAMLAFPPDSVESYAMMAEAARISREVSGNQAEIHAQLALNLAT